jgi:dihydrofolate reductase
MSKKARIAMILASTINGEIGYKNTIPWKLKGDLPRFKDLTTGNVLIMGRSSYESLPGPLKDRIVIVLTRDPAFASEVHDPENKVYSASSLPEAIENARSFKTPIIFLAGGASIYEEGMGLADYVYLTLVHKSAPKYDTRVKNMRFPEDVWTQVEFKHVFEPDAEFPELRVPSHTYHTFERIEK